MDCGTAGIIGRMASPDSSSSPKTSRSEHLRHIVDHAAHGLPAQGPIGVFIHHNTYWLTRQIDDRVEQIEVPNHTAVPMVRLDIRFAEDLREEVVELAEPTDEDETKHYILRSDLVAFASPTGLHESSADQAALTSFRLLAFSSRGSPSAWFTRPPASTAGLTAAS
jgi:hypothetical protein